MVPDCRRRLEVAVDELRNYIVSVSPLLNEGGERKVLTQYWLDSDFWVDVLKEGLEDDEEVKQTEEYQAAKQILEQVRAQLESPLPTV